MGSDKPEQQEKAAVAPNPALQESRQEQPAPVDPLQQRAANDQLVAKNVIPDVQVAQADTAREQLVRGFAKPAAAGERTEQPAPAARSEAPTAVEDRKRAEANLDKLSPGILKDTVATPNPDGSTVYTDKSGKVKGIAYEGGSFAGVQYDDKGMSRVVRADKAGNVISDESRNANGSWTNKGADGKGTDTFEGKYGIAANGRIEFLNKDKTLDRWDTHGGKVYLDQNGRPLAMTDRNGMSRQYGYNESGVLAAMKETFPNGGQRTWKLENGAWNDYDKDNKRGDKRFEGVMNVGEDGSLRQINIAKGEQITAYPNGKVIASEYKERVQPAPDGSRVVFEANSGKPSTVMAADGTYRRYSYDSNGHMESSTAYDRNGKVTSTIRQQNGRWVALDPQGRDLGMGDVTKIDVDKEGNMRSTWRGGSETVNKADGSMIMYNRNGQLTNVVDARANERTFRYGQDGSLAAVGYTLGNNRKVELRHEGNMWNLYDDKGAKMQAPPIDEVNVDRGGNLVIVDKTNNKKMTLGTNGMRNIFRLDNGLPIEPDQQNPQRRQPRNNG